MELHSKRDPSPVKGSEKPQTRRGASERGDGKKGILPSSVGDFFVQQALAQKRPKNPESEGKTGGKLREKKHLHRLKLPGGGRGEAMGRGEVQCDSGVGVSQGGEVRSP